MHARKGTTLGRTLAIVLSLLLAGATAAYAQPSNDDFTDATVVSAIPYSQTLDVSDATSSPLDPDTCASPPRNGKTVWYTFTPSDDVRLAADTFGSDYDTVLSVWTSGSGGRSSPVACNDDVFPFEEEPFQLFQSALIFDALGGVTYYFMIGSFDDGPAGSLTFSLFDAPPPPETSISLDPVAVIRGNGRVILTGTFTCSMAGPGNVLLEVSLGQRRDGGFVQAFGSTILDCDSAIEWVVETSGAGTFAPGPARAEMRTFTRDVYGQPSEDIAIESVMLRRRPSPSG